MQEAGRIVREYVCVFRTQLGEGIGSKLPTDAVILQWILRWVGICYSRYTVGRDGLAAYERRNGRRCKAIVIPFGEKVWYKRPRKRSGQKEQS